MVDRFLTFVAENPACFHRELSIGHVTGAAWLVDPSHTSVLLTHHRKLDRWLQLGGHADGEGDILEVALSEAREESGITSISILSHKIYDIDIHVVPARGVDPEHLHYDVRFALRAHDLRYTVSSESHDLQWVPINALSSITNEPSMVRMAEKWLRK
jgi:8-oxo-dGTP pyrophosphatase MutT (NUDIX family)